MQQNTISRSRTLLWPLIITAVTLLSGCFATVQSTDRSRVKDSGPTQAVDLSHVPDAVPKVEPRTIAGNKSPYTVLGKTYRVLPDSYGYKERGVASWYGRKFHGARTSNGEVYDMYGMTAAHKTLPIPSYVQVTNLDSGKKIIVRVNDRGPFHDGRIIDLSYAAAQKLGFHDSGTARVEVEAIDPIAYQQNQTIQNVAVADPLSSSTYLQAGAFANRESAERLRTQIEQWVMHPVFIRNESIGGDVVSSVNSVQNLFKVRIGPLRDNLDIVTIKQLLQQHNLPTPLVVYD